MPTETSRGGGVGEGGAGEGGAGRSHRCRLWRCGCPQGRGGAWKRAPWCLPGDRAEARQGPLLASLGGGGLGGSWRRGPG